VSATIEDAERIAAMEKSDEDCVGRLLAADLRVARQRARLFGSDTK
jgi:hypothetical protein